MGEIRLERLAFLSLIKTWTQYTAPVHKIYFTPNISNIDLLMTIIDHNQ